MAFRDDRPVSGLPGSEDRPVDRAGEPPAGAPADHPAPEDASPAARAPGDPGTSEARPRDGAAEPAEKPRSRRKLVFLVLALAVLAGGSLYGWRYWTEGRFLVATDDAYVAGDITILAAKVSGYIASIEIQNDQPVRQGEVIARIDDVDYKLAVQAARDKLATLEATTSRIGRQVVAARAQVAQVEPQIASARAESLRTASEFERQTRLAQSDFASRAKYEQARSDRDRAVAAVQAAEAGLDVARANVEVLEAQRIEAERTAGEARTQLARAERDLAFTEIRAPVSGVVGNRAVQIGSYVAPGTRLAALIPLQTVHVDAHFKETQLGPIHPGQVVRLEVDAYPGRHVPAVVESIAPASGSQYSLLPPENATGNFTKIVQRVTVRVKVDPEAAAQGFLRPGMSVVTSVDIRDPKVAQAALDAKTR
ncbi:HlyD family secretion protein [Enterovirga rhinocerotis]|uniref:Membrane fusion protein (Multidrug efflux system) n=1 Tax=Enterovirga rhinocerotis TaxID=1339210 RepID=A0A4R7BTG3_9HYPH|nr:HlyD family secretion protein [Enterovirga rhinocerotis]TDR89038.1 membrane fusion protein (multidrug efflux system) [Enterovirga rhinocerotis]